MNAEERIQTIRQSKLMIDVTADEFARLDALLPGSYEKYKKDTFLLSEGQTLQFVSIILSGSIDVIRLLPGGDYIFINQLSEKDILGIELVYQGRRKQRESYYNYKTTSGAELYQIPTKYIWETGHIPEALRIKLQKNLMMLLSCEVSRLQKKIDILSTKKLRDRIMLYLRECQQKAGKRTFSIPLNREELAKYLGVNRSSLSGELGKMCAEGIIRCQKNEFEILADANGHDMGG